jgi:hypothetical protein
MNDKSLPLVTFEQAKRLKAAGLDWPTMHFAIDKDPDCEIFYAPTTPNPAFHVKEPRDWNNEGAPGASQKGGYVSIPTVALALAWVQDVKNKDSYVSRMSNGRYGGWIDMRMGGTYGEYRKIAGYFETFQTAESALLDELLTILENGK